MILASLVKEIQNAFTEGAQIEKVQSLVKKALAESISPIEIMNTMRDGLATVGKKYEQGELFLSELIISGIMAQEVSNILRPYLQNSETEFLGKVVIGTVKGDIHDLGKNLVSMMLTSAGFQVIDLGVDVSQEKFVEAARGDKPEVVAMSCLLTSAMDEMKLIVPRLEEAGVRNRVKVLVGGRPITPDFAREIGADGYGKDAVDAVNVARTALKKAS